MTSFDEIINRSLRKIEQNSDFFSYYNVSSDEVEQLIRKQIIGYIQDAIDLWTSKCQLDFDIYDYDEEMEQFNCDLTKREIGILASLVYQVYFERQLAKLNAFALRMSPSDLSTFSPASERTSFIKLVEDIRHENDIMLSTYASIDRETGEHKELDYSTFEEDDES